MQGKSVLDVFAGEAETPYAEASQVGYELFGLKAWFDGNWKILLMAPPFGRGEWELFNLKDDPSEINDLSEKHPQRLAEMIRRWEQYKKDNGVLDMGLDSNN